MVIIFLKKVNVFKNVEKLELSYTTGGIQNSEAAKKNSMEFPQ